MAEGRADGGLFGDWLLAALLPPSPVFEVSTPGGGLRACCSRCSSMSRGMSRRRASTLRKRRARRSSLWPLGGMSTRARARGPTRAASRPSRGQRTKSTISGPARVTAASRRGTAGAARG